MGYSESYCALCFVTFAIARIRTATEPESAAWAYHGEGFVDESDTPWDDDNGIACGPSTEPGCSYQLREGGGDGVGGPDDEREHLAGPGCHCERGYAGSRITVAEMKGCRAVRAIIAKTGEWLETPWKDEPDDEPWERTTRYFFSGLGDGSPDESPLEDLDRVRHGAEYVCLTNGPGSPNEESGLPVHQTCWEIFKRVSMRECGYVDVHGLWIYASIGDLFNDRFNVPRHPAIRAGRDQWWSHMPGSEWLAANPVDIPGFAAIVRTVIAEKPLTEKEVEWQSNEWKYSPCTKKAKVNDATSSENDPLSRLPTELCLMVLQQLKSRDIANARLVFRSLRHLPDSLFRTFFLEDFPWMWEAWDVDHHNVVWYRLYMRYKFEWSYFKGLRNRERIWKEITAILHKIRVCRADGRINGVTGYEDDATMVETDE